MFLKDESKIKGYYVNWNVRNSILFLQEFIYTNMLTAK